MFAYNTHTRIEFYIYICYRYYFYLLHHCYTQTAHSLNIHFVAAILGVLVHHQVCLNIVLCLCFVLILLARHPFRLTHSKTVILVDLVFV